MTWNWWKLASLKLSVSSIQFTPLVCESPSPQISCECIWIQELPLNHESNVFVFFMKQEESRLSESRSVIVHLERQYLKWCNNQSLTELLITVSFRPINVFTTQLSLAWAGSWTLEATADGIIIQYSEGEVQNILETLHQVWVHSNNFYDYFLDIDLEALWCILGLYY